MENTVLKKAAYDVTKTRAEGARAAHVEFWLSEFKKYSSYLLRIACKWTDGNVERAKRALQDMWVKLARNPKPPDQVRKPRRYLAKAVKSAALDAQPDKRLDSLQDVDPNGSRFSFDPHTHNLLEVTQLVHLCAEGLEGLDRKVFELWKQDYTTREIAEALSISVAAVSTSKKRIKYRARKNLRGLI